MAVKGGNINGSSVHSFKRGFAFSFSFASVLIHILSVSVLVSVVPMLPEVLLREEVVLLMTEVFLATT